MEKKSMSVMEMGKLLGLKKTDSYWLVKKRYFRTVMVCGKMRVLTDSFYEWLATQKHYKIKEAESDADFSSEQVREENELHSTGS
jgi:plasmid maintenance system antidote protein VapI